MDIQNLTTVKMTDTGKLLLVRLIKNNESDFGNISYDREYETYDYDKILALVSNNAITPAELSSAKSSNLVVKGVTTLPFNYAKDVAPELPPIRIVEHITYTIDIAKPKQPVRPDWVFD